MAYTLTPEDLRVLAQEFKEDLAGVYTAMHDPDPETPALSLGALRDLERRRESLLHQQGRALAMANTIGHLNSMDEDDNLIHKELGNEPLYRHTQRR